MHTDRVVDLTTVSDFIHNFGQKNNVSSCQVQAFHHRDVSESLNLFINIYLYMYIHEMKYFDHSHLEKFCRLLGCNSMRPLTAVQRVITTEERSQSIRSEDPHCPSLLHDLKARLDCDSAHGHG